MADAVLVTSITVVSKARLVAVDVTRDIEQLVRKSGVTAGIVHLYVPHTTAGLFVNERDDPAVAVDIMETLDKLVPRSGKFKHVEGNADSHVKSVLVGSDASIPIAGGWMSLGRWQGIFFAEFDGPRTRTVQVTIKPQ
ncbi:MAG: secondary thiamine-phosphate synthase enzyme YjbQ [bacterium]